MEKDKKETTRSEQQLILDNLGAIVAQAKCFKPNSVTDMDDFKQEGAIALLKAIRKHDPAKGKLTTYAWPAIFRAIHRSSKKFTRRNASGQPSEIPLEFDPLESEENQARKIKDLIEFLPELSKEEFEIIMLRVSGYTLEEIGSMYGKHKQSIRIQLEKISKKIRQAND